MAHPWKRQSADSAGVNLTPLLDVVLQLITFFMMLIHFGSRIEGPSRWARLPVAPAALANGDLGFDRLVATIDSRGAIRDGDRALAGLAAESWWDEQARSRREGQAHPRRKIEGRHSRRRRTSHDGDHSRRSRCELWNDPSGVATAQKKGFAKFTLVVLRGAEP